MNNELPDFAVWLKTSGKPVIYWSRVKVSADLLDIE